MVSGKLKVLVAEDEPAMLSLVSRHVRNLGFEVAEAPDGDAAWKQAQKHHPDLVILDVMMPGMSGWEVCKRIKAHAAEGTFGQTGVIMLTGIGENLNEMTSPLFAADAWLNKPFDFADLDERIQEVLAKHAKSPQEPAAKKPAAKKPAAKKPAAKKPAAKKAAAKKPAAKKAQVPRPKGAVTKPAAKKPAAKKPAAKKAQVPRPKGAVTKPAAKKPAAKKPAAKKK
jgi:DNA-binding response OmpR family regulator